MSNSEGTDHPVLAAGAVVVRPVDDGFRFLLLRAYRYWDFPKGEIEPGDRNPLEAARREVAEETGLEDLELPWGELWYETEPYRDGRKLARYYLLLSRKGEVELGIGPDLGRPEHHEHRWVTEEEGEELLGERVGKVLRWAAETIAD